MSDTWLTPIREDPGRRRIAVLAALALGIGVASMHWLGIVAAGALVGVFAPSPRRAILWGIGVGVIIVATFVLQAVAVGTADRLLGAGRPLVVAVVVGLVAAPLGALVRAVE
ncbi:MAG: hypothetical protein ABEJ57_01570 [Halobacteriaceae archaeon]